MICLVFATGSSFSMSFGVVCHRENCQTNFSRTETEINQSVFRKNHHFFKAGSRSCGCSNLADSMVKKPQVLLILLPMSQGRAGW